MTDVIFLHESVFISGNLWSILTVNVMLLGIRFGDLIALYLKTISRRSLGLFGRWPRPTLFYLLSYVCSHIWEQKMPLF